MAGARGYQNYRGRTPLWKKLLAVVLVLISAALPAYSQAFLLCLGLSQVLVPTAANLMNIVVQVVLSYPTMKFWIMPADKGRVGT